VFENVLPLYLGAVIYGKATEGYLSEQASRRSAMENANDNAEEIIDDLAIKYNRIRQANITQEISEIVAGAEAI
jgi:F-type H+-transporting ATPase subunit gamma